MCPRPRILTEERQETLLYLLGLTAQIVKFKHHRICNMHLTTNYIFQWDIHDCLNAKFGQRRQNTTPSSKPIGTVPYVRESFDSFGSMLSPSTQILPLGTSTSFSQCTLFPTTSSKASFRIVSPGRPKEIKFQI